jgi:dTDP-4-dehydrorhamnose 3,5-epimerase
VAIAVSQSSIPGVLLIKPSIHHDERGWFSEGFRASEFARAGISEPFVQDNVSWSARRGTLRGLHFQRPPFAQAKLVRCLRGSIVDVVVDLRRGSPTERTWSAFELDADAGNMVWVPRGLAHGYQTLVDDCLITYKTTAEYSPEHELGIRWDDRTIGIVWPIPHAGVSPRDAALPLAADVPSVFEWPS